MSLNAFRIGMGQTRQWTESAHKPDDYADEPDDDR